MKWQPIETAPKDESVILLSLPKVGALKDEGARRVFEGRWNYNQQTFTSVNGFIIHDVATHWMPLPEPSDKPQLKGKEGELGWADNTGLDDKSRWFTKNGKSVDCHCKLIPFGTSFVMDYKPECEVHGIEKES